MGRNRDESPEAVEKRLIMKAGKPVHQGYQKVTLTPLTYYWVCPTCDETTEEDCVPKIVTCDNEDCGASFFTDPPEHNIEGREEPEWRQGFPEKAGIYYFKVHKDGTVMIVTVWGKKQMFLECGLNEPVPKEEVIEDCYFKPVEPLTWDNLQPWKE